MEQGLSRAEARRRLLADGPNELPAARRRGPWQLAREVCSEPMFLLLMACGAIYLLLGDRHEALMLLGFVLLVMAISLVQQRRTERSLDALRDLSCPRALVERDGETVRLPARELVRGDLVLLAEGDRVPADLVLLAGSGLAVDESLLTGESLPVDKDAQTGGDAAALFAGTLVTRGTARARVVATGVHSALGRIGQSLGEIVAHPTPLQRETRQIVRLVAVAGLGLALALSAAYWATRGNALTGLLAGLTFAMAILPEELPVVLTLFLGLGAWRLAREQVLVRNNPAIETLGSATLLCVDKTGTLTENRMTLARLWSDGETADTPPARHELPESLHALLEHAVLACHRTAYDPMETAIAEAGHRLLAETEHLHGDWTLVDDYPLSPHMLAMSRVWQSPDRAARIIAAKGAPEAIVDLCHLDAARQREIMAAAEAFAARGLRVLAVAQAAFGAAALPSNQHDFDFVFLGLLALEDPLRANVPAAIAECGAAGIQVAMMTGDHPVTALSIARRAGIDCGSGALTGADLDRLDAAGLEAALAHTRVFCRLRPEQKLQLVEAFRRRGEVVAMTGDGVNDAPALKAADIGVAMGARGTEVAREAADLVLLDDDFASLVSAVRHGRRVFANLQKAIAFIVAVHVPIVGLSLAPVLFGWPMLLMPVHVLFLQLIIDPACSIVFEAEPAEAGRMHAPPRAPGSRLFGREVLVRGLWQGCGLLALLLAVYVAMHAASAGSDDQARTLTYLVLVMAAQGLILTNRSWQPFAWRQASVPNRFFARIVPLNLLWVLAIYALAPLRALFAFALLPAPWLAAGAALALASMVWFDLAKRLARRT